MDETGDTRRLLAAVSRVLFDSWDPIGAHAMDPAWPRDEYEGYAAGVLELVLSHSSDDVIAEHLAQIEHQWMGLIPSPLGGRVKIASEIRAAVKAVSGSGN
jgi:hypothetical protein